MTAPPGGQTLAGWPVGAAFMPPGTFAAAETPRAAYMRPLQTVPKNGVGELARRGGIHAARDVCGGGNSAGRICAAPTNRSEKWRLRMVCRGGIHASREPCAAANTPGGIIPPLRIARKPSSAWRGVGDAAPYGATYFCLCPRAQTPPFLLSIIFYLLSIYYFPQKWYDIPNPHLYTKRSDPF